MNKDKYFIQNNREILKVTVLKEQNGFALIQLPGSDGAIRVRSTKLYKLMGVVDTVENALRDMKLYEQR